MIAYSSIGHMGFAALGIATLTPVGLNAALFANVAHGLITGLLFFLAGAVQERYGTTDMDALGGGMLAKAPYLASILTFAAVASLGLPGLAGFWGEMLALLGAFRPHAGLPRPAFTAFMVAGGLGALLTAVYFLRMLAKITHGAVTERRRQVRFADVMSHELLAWTPLITATLFIGLWPKTLLALTDGAVRALLGAR
jgi:NADH-quinone oxidoreductase subunit M